MAKQQAAAVQQQSQPQEQAQQKERSWLGEKAEKAADGVKQWWQDLRIGDGHAGAMGRLGLAELRQAASYGQGSIEQPTGPGIYGVATQLEVNEARGNDGRDGEEASGQLSLDGMRSQAKEQQSQQQERGDERGRDREGRD